MKRIRIIFIICLLFGSLQIIASDNPKHKLTQLFEQGEQCYLTDDYEQLESHLDQFREIYLKCYSLLGDSADVFYAYYYKMEGDYHFGLTNGSDNHSSNAESSYYKSLNIFKKRNSDRNLITLHEELAQLYYKMKRYDSARLHLDTIFSYYDSHLNDLGITSYEKDYYRTLSQIAICNARLGQFHNALQQIGEAQKYFKKQKSEFYYETLRRQGKILMMQADSLGTDNYKKARNCYEQYVKDEYASIAQRLDTMSSGHRAQHWLATHKFLYDCYRMGNHAPELLYNLALFSKGYLLAYENNHKVQQVRWEQVRKKLTSKDCAIEFVQYFGRHDEKRLGCLVLRKNGTPQFIDLFSTDSLLSLQLTSKMTVGKAFDSSNPEDKDSLYTDTRLIQQIWSPRLMDAIGNAAKIYFAPDGLIHQWAIEYIMPDSQKVCYRLSSTRNLLRQPASLKMQSALLCGGVSFRAAYNPIGRDNDYMAYRYLKPRVRSVSSLPNTKIEVDSIYAFRHNPNDILLEEADATDERVLQLLRQNHFDIVHITSHGHYLGKIDIHNDLRPLSEDLSLSQCGIMFAGAANTLSDDQFDDNYYDGVISGTEFAKQDLSQTELVVLKCCQTGQGRLTDDGIYGLQRALKLAGVNTMIVSLWSIWEYSSGILLRYFYEEIERQREGKIDLHAALTIAQKRLMEYKRESYVFDPATFGYKQETIRYNTPQHTCPLILIDAY